VLLYLFGLSALRLAYFGKLQSVTLDHALSLGLIDIKRQGDTDQSLQGTERSAHSRLFID